MYENWKILKSELEEKQEEYMEVADWCNESGEYHIEEQGVYYAVARNPEPTEDEQKAKIKELCALYINEISWRVERYNTQKELDIETSDSEATYIKILQYMQYLREYDNLGEWWTEEPQTFEDWNE